MFWDFICTRTKSAKVLTESSFFTLSKQNLVFGWKWHFPNHTEVSEITTDTTLQLCTTAQSIYIICVKAAQCIHHAAFLNTEVMHGRAKVVKGPYLSAFV